MFPLSKLLKTFVTIVVSWLENAAFGNPVSVKYAYTGVFFVGVKVGTRVGTEVVGTGVGRTVVGAAVG